MSDIATAIGVFALLAIVFGVFGPTLIDRFLKGSGRTYHDSLQDGSSSNGWFGDGSSDGGD